MEQAGVIRTLAEPTLTAISGESANFIAGGEFPIPSGYTCSQPSSGSSSICQYGIDFKKFGVSLNFTPNYIADAMGFWKEQGLNVKITQLGGIQAMNAMLAGSVEFSNSSLATIIRANIRGQKVLAIGTALSWEIDARRAAGIFAGLVVVIALAELTATVR